MGRVQVRFGFWEQSRGQPGRGHTTCATQLSILPPSLSHLGDEALAGSPLLSSRLPPSAHTASPRPRAHAQAQEKGHSLNAMVGSCWGLCSVLRTLPSSPWSLTFNRISSVTPLPGPHNGTGTSGSGRGYSLGLRCLLGKERS